MFVASIVIFLCIHQNTFAFFKPTNETDLTRCKVYYSRSGNVYKDYFELTKPKKNDTDLLLDFHFTVLAASDAHLLIAPSRATEKTDPAYEIVIGAGGNTFCDIRRMQKNNVKASKRIKGLLSALDVRSFWIHMTSDGVLEVGKEGEQLAFISWKDQNPLPTNVISFSTWPGVEAKWFFDCINDDIKRIKRNLTQVERLRKDLLTNYDPYSRPVKNHTDTTVVTLAPKINSFSIDEHRSILQVHGVAEIRWTDEKLIWNGSQYGGLTEFRANTIEIWKPNIILFNSVDRDVTISSDALLTVRNTGEVIWYPILDLRSWCGSDNYDNWPKDQRRCDLLFTFWTDFANLEIEYPNTSSSVWDHRNSQWIIDAVEILVNYGKSGENTSGISDKFSTKIGPPTLDLCLVMRRNHKIYEAIFVATYIVSAIFMLSIFCVSPFGPYKISLGCLQIVISVSSLIWLGIILPAHSFSVPYLVQLFKYSLTAGCISIIVSIFVINISRNEKERPFPSILLKILTSKVVKTMFCLPETKRDEYGKLSTMSKMKDSQQYFALCGIAIDRIFFILGLFLLMYSVCLY